MLLQAIKREILGEDSEDEEGPEGSGDEEEGDDEDLEETERQQEAQQAIQVGTRFRLQLTYVVYDLACGPRHVCVHLPAEGATGHSSECGACPQRGPRHTC